MCCSQQHCLDELALESASEMNESECFFLGTSGFGRLLCDFYRTASLDVDGVLHTLAREAG